MEPRPETEPAGCAYEAGVTGEHPPGSRLLTVGHGTAAGDEFAALLRGAGVQLVVDVRSAPGSRRFPQYRRGELAQWLPAAGIGYRWEPALGGFRKPNPGSLNVSLRHPSFRAYADYMATGSFRQALTRLLGDASQNVTVIMCAETLWWRCHRRLIADAATVLAGAAVWHLGHDGSMRAHRVTPEVRRAPGDTLVYDAGQSRQTPPGAKSLSLYDKHAPGG